MNNKKCGEAVCVLKLNSLHCYSRVVGFQAGKDLHPLLKFIFSSLSVVVMVTIHVLHTCQNVQNIYTLIENYKHPRLTYFTLKLKCITTPLFTELLSVFILKLKE